VHARGVAAHQRAQRLLRAVSAFTASTVVISTGSISDPAAADTPVPAASVGTIGLATSSTEARTRPCRRGTGAHGSGELRHAADDGSSGTGGQPPRAIQHQGPRRNRRAAVLLRCTPGD
jgi:hypothetical protein